MPDVRLVVAVLAIALAGIAKGVTGMGLPVVGVPILVALYGDLRLVLPLTVVATTLADVVMAARWRRDPRELAVVTPFAIAGLLGIIAGTRLLLFVRPAILSALLAAIVIVFITVTWLGKMPTLGARQARRWGAVAGFAGGVAQGSAGASGPIVTSYLLSVGLSRGAFLFAINVIFAVLDATQLISLARLGLLHAGNLPAVLGVCVVTGIGMAAGFALQSRLDDRLFRRGILILLACAAAGLIVRAARG